MLRQSAPPGITRQHVPHMTSSARYAGQAPDCGRIPEAVSKAGPAAPLAQGQPPRCWHDNPLCGLPCAGHLRKRQHDPSAPLGHACSTVLPAGTGKQPRDGCVVTVSSAQMLKPATAHCRGMLPQLSCPQLLGRTCVRCLRAGLPCASPSSRPPHLKVLPCSSTCHPTLNTACSSDTQRTPEVPRPPAAHHQNTADHHCKSFELPR